MFAQPFSQMGLTKGYLNKKRTLESGRHHGWKTHNFDKAYTRKLKTKAWNSSRFIANFIPFIALAFKYFVKKCCHNNKAWIGKSMYSQLLSQANKTNISHFTINTMSLCPNTWKSYLKQINEEIATFLLKSGIFKNIQWIFTFPFAIESFPPALTTQYHQKMPEDVQKGTMFYAPVARHQPKMYSGN